VTALRLALVALLAGSLAVAIVARPARSDPPQARLASAYDVRTTTTPHTLVTGPGLTPAILHRVALITHCPVLAVEWASTNVEPGTPGAWAVLELVLDGRVVQRGYFGAGTGTYEDGPARLAWLGTAPPGLHAVEARFSGGGPRGNWGMPYTNAPHVGLDLLLVREQPPSGARPDDCAA
jgi:hypothetical protein